LRGPAAVMGDRGDVLDLRNPETDRVQRANGRLAAGTRAFDTNLEVLHAIILGRRAGALGRDLGCERRALARALEAAAAGRRPSERVTLAVGDRDDRVVEGRVHVRHRVQNLALDLLAAL